MNNILEANIEEVENHGIDFEEFQDKFENEIGFMTTLEDVAVSIVTVYGGYEELASAYLTDNGHEDIEFYVDLEALGNDLLHDSYEHMEMDDGTIVEFFI